MPAFIGFIGSLTIVLVLNSASWWETPWTVKRVLAAYTGVSICSFWYYHLDVSLTIAARSHVLRFDFLEVP